ncbi:hypothetical protein HMPREF0591_3512 [Mycobacterium parascrofulaceum ATCC BAA-614]|uniref:Uncharacterized protein n=1 Tax=Mycobacterium parascrofulaceum ATCC BAA-614 TaxID=525368 RepID=D5PBH3_9MYCO|nr:hypothetical protein HMPREF0591_3512 [Mycobacterium parascrofulaceum ATCC BAA-614]
MTARMTTARERPSRCGEAGMPGGLPVGERETPGRNQFRNSELR